MFHFRPKTIRGSLRIWSSGSGTYVLPKTTSPWIKETSPGENSINNAKLLSSWMRSLYPGGGWGAGLIRKREEDAGKLGETELIQQDDHDMQEVPLAVIKSDDGGGGDEDDKGDKIKSYIELDAREEAAFVEGFNNFNTPQQILNVLDTIPAQEVTPFVSLGILRKLFQLENNFGFRNDGKPWTVASDNSIFDTFARTAIVTRLIDTILSTEDVNILIGALNVLRCERIERQPSGSSSNYKEKLFRDILLRVTKGQFTLSQVCEAVIALGKIEKERKTLLENNLIDKLWVGIFDKSDDITADNITLLFQVLPYFKKSRRLVLNLAEKKLVLLWWKAGSTTISQICDSIMADRSFKDNGKLREGVGISNRALSALSKCTNLNMHQVTEEELLIIVKAFQDQNFCDSSIEKALNKYMKVKGLRISDPNLVAAILEYAKSFKIRSSNILDSAAEFVVLHKGANLSPPHVTTIITAFGLLDYQPPNGVKFWQIIEGYLNDKFIQFPPQDLIETLLSCVYLMKYPLNFADRVFSPYFLDRLHTCDQDATYLQNLRSRLKLLDIALTIECSNKYSGPMLPKDFSVRSVFIDGRIIRMGNWLEDVVKEVLGVHCMVEKFVVLPGLPLNSTYIADILISNTQKYEIDRYNYLKNRINSRLNSGITSTENDRDLTVLLIHLPEHYSLDGANLIGPEALKIRHLKAFGFNVATTNYSKLSQLKVHPTEIRDYLKSKLLDSGYPC